MAYFFMKVKHGHVLQCNSFAIKCCLFPLFKVIFLLLCLALPLKVCLGIMFILNSVCHMNWILIENNMSTDVLPQCKHSTQWIPKLRQEGLNFLNFYPFELKYFFVAYINLSEFLACVSSDLEWMKHAFPCF